MQETDAGDIKPSDAFDSQAVRPSRSLGPDRFSGLNHSNMFSKCPYCNASILDEAEEFCPSCDQPLKEGVSKDKPKPKAASPAKAKPAAGGKPKAAGKPAAGKPAAAKKPAPKGPGAGVAASDSDDDDPFDIGGQAGKQAIRVQPKPSKGRMHRVECPMCESPGFIAKSAAGSEVRCWNKECRLPLFTPPAIEKEPEPEPEPKKKPIAAIVAALLILGGVGAGTYFVFFADPNGGEKVIKPIDPSTIQANDDENGKPKTNQMIRENDNPVVKAGPMTVAAIVDRAIKQMPDALDHPDNGAKNDSFRLAAEAYHRVGKDAEAKNILSRLPSRVSFYKVRPLVIQAEQALAAGDPAGAKKFADEAVALAGSLPPAGREALDWATDLAVVLVQLDEVDAAARLVEKNYDAGIRGELSAMLAGARHSGTYDLADIAGGNLIRETPNPQWVAVTRALISAGKRDVALAWAKRGAGSVGADALVAWAGTLGAEEKLNSETITSVSNSPKLSARLLAAAGLELYAQMRSATTDGESSEIPAEVSSLLAAAIAKLPNDERPPMATPTTIDFYRSANKTRSGLPRTADVRGEALAFVKVAEFQLAIGQTDAGWQTLQTGLERLRAASPSPVDMRAKVEGYESRRSALRSELESSLDISSRSDVNSAFNLYRRQVDKFADAAKDRFALQERLARVAMSGGAEKQLVAWLNTANTEPWWSSQTAASLKQSEDPQIASAAAAKADRKLEAPPKQWVVIVENAIASGDAVGLARQLRQLDNPHRRGLWAGVAASLLVRGENPAGLRDFLQYLGQHPVTRREVVEMASAQSTRSGSGQMFYETLIAPLAQLEPQELVAMFSGIAAGADAIPAPAPVAEEQPDAEASE